MSETTVSRRSTGPLLVVLGPRGRGHVASGSYRVEVEVLDATTAGQVIRAYGETMVQVSRRVRPADVAAVAEHCLTAHPDGYCTVAACPAARTALRCTIIPWSRQTAG